MMTQWRTAGYGATGLDYAALPVVMRLCGVARSEWPGVFESIRILEDAALMTMSAIAERERERSKRRG